MARTEEPLVGGVVTYELVGGCVSRGASVLSARVVLRPTADSAAVLIHLALAAIYSTHAFGAIDRFSRIHVYHSSTDKHRL